MNTGCKRFCGASGDVLSINFLSLKMSGVAAAWPLNLGLELRVTGGRLSMRRRILVIISPATLTTLVGHLRGGVLKIKFVSFKSRTESTGPGRDLTTGEPGQLGLREKAKPQQAGFSSHSLWPV